MKPVHIVDEVLEPWIGTVAATISSVFDRAIRPKRVRLVQRGEELVLALGESSDADPEQLPANFGEALKGATVEMVLDPEQFVCRPIEVPARAAGFLEGIVRAQIDRLTPWNANDACFGWTPPSANGADTISAVVVATAKTTINKYIERLAPYQPAAISVWTRPHDHAIGLVRVYEQNSRQYLGVARLKRALKSVLLILIGLTFLTLLPSLWATDYLSAQDDELTRAISQQRASIRAVGDGDERSPPVLLQRRRLAATPTVVIVDVLANALPDNTYATELHFADNKVQIVGLSADASALVSLIEQTKIFMHATFFAPTTISPSERGDRFHIEAQIGASEKGAK